MAHTRSCTCGGHGRDAGFTLMELLTVIIVIGVLTAVAIPVFLNQRAKAADASLRADIRQMVAVQNAYVTEHPHLHAVPFAYREPDTTNPMGTHNTYNLPVRLSPGNYLRSTQIGEAYCVQAWNHDSRRYFDETHALTWNSLKGGYDPTATC